MLAVTLTCSRCHQTIEGFADAVFTAGYYNVGAGSWHRFAREGETILCEPCMWLDPGYIEMYLK